MSVATEIQRLQQAKADIKAAIEKKGVTVGDGTIDTYAEKINEISSGDSGDYEQGYEDGKQAEYDTFWDNFQDYDNRTDYNNAFCGYSFNNNIFKPKYRLKPLTAERMFYSNSVLTEINETLDYSECNNVGTAFAYSKLTAITDIIVNEKLDLSNAFRACGGLVTLGISGVIGKSINLQWSKSLNIESLKTIIMHLKNYSGTDSEYTCTITFSSDCWAALEAESAAPNGDTWKNYIYNSLCWKYA